MLKRLLILALLVPGAQAQNQAQDILHKVDDHYNHLASLRTRYTEHYSGMGLDRTESGTLTLKKPGRMRWVYDAASGKPGKLFVLDGSFAWFYTPGDPTVQRIPARQLDDMRTPLRLLLGHTQLQKELDRITVTPTGDTILITGVPNGMEQRIKLLTLRVTPTGAIQTMKLEELSGSITEFAFTGMEENAKVQDGDFKFIPPPGVSIINSMPTM